MSHLSETWFIEGNIDFESKKYTLLAFLQKIQHHFDEHRLYPQLSDVLFHYRNLMAFKENKTLLKSRFPKKLTGLQIEEVRLIYEEIVSDDELMAEIEAIVQYSLRKIQSAIATGTDLYDFVEDNMTITPVGLLPIEAKEGYFFLSDGHGRSVRVYEYQLSLFEQANDPFRALRTQYIAAWERNWVNTHESIKSELMRSFKKYALPAVYAIETRLRFPVEETLLPVAKRRLVQYLCQG